MFVGVNAVGLAPGWGGSQELYLRRVLEHMERLGRSLRFVVFTDEENDASFEQYPRLKVTARTDAQEAAAGEGVDVLFSSLYSVPKKGTVPLVVHVPDLWPFSAGAKRKMLGRDPVRDAKRVAVDAAAFVAPSEFLRKELLEKLGVTLERTVVAPYGIDDEFGQPHPSVVEEPYVLVVGRTRPYKNLDRLMEAFERATAGLPHTLVMVGRPYEGERESWGNRVVRLEKVPRSYLAGLYRHSALFVCPSLYEGSGISVLEAMRCGALVATGRVGGITEIAGDVPLFFNPESVDSMVGVLRRAFEVSAEERKQRSHFGQQQAQGYRWEDCASQTLVALRRA